MVAWSQICATLSLAAGVLAAPATSAHGPLKLFTELKQLPSLWSSNGAADKGAMIKAQIGLKQGNIQGLQDKLLDIANPESPNYGKWLSQDEIAAYTAPPAGHVDQVKSWLAANGIHEVSQPTNDWIEFSVPVHQMESLLDTKYEWFTHQGTGTKLPRTTKYSVPEALHPVIDMITPTTAFYASVEGHANANNAKQAHVTSSALHRRKGQCRGDGTIDPNCVNSIYNVDYTSSGSQTVASTGLLGYGANHRDFYAFGQSYVPGLQDFRDISVAGGTNNGDGSTIEGNLDTQHLGGISYPNPSVFLNLAPTSNDATSFNDALANFASYMTSTSNPPSVVSTSYGGEENGYDPSYMDRICNEFMKVGSRGSSLFFSSGDNGVGGNGHGASCNSGFYALWPASCPWVTAVGGTWFTNNGESVANFNYFNNAVTSPGGGYSWHFGAPAYNSNVTAAYTNTLDSSYNGYYNPRGRGYPDISLVAVEYQTYVNGQLGGYLGTSASSPAVAALVGVLNDYRRSQGRSTLGFINPLLYSAKAQNAIRDVTYGNNFGCNTQGFYASNGWDPASGLGSFDFAALRSII